jgi:CheY-like chemotaxis protein
MTDRHIGTILVVEDEAELRFILVAHLRASGFDVFEAVDGLKAVELATDKLPDVVLMDIGLPVMDGIAATRALKSDGRTSSIPIIMLTARTRTEDIVKVWRRARVLLKPLTAESRQCTVPAGERHRTRPPEHAT